MRGGRGGVRVGIRGNFNKKSTFSEIKLKTGEKMKKINFVYFSTSSSLRFERY